MFGSVNLSQCVCVCANVWLLSLESVQKHTGITDNCSLSYTCKCYEENVWCYTQLKVTRSLFPSLATDTLQVQTTWGGEWIKTGMLVSPQKKSNVLIRLNYRWYQYISIGPIYCLCLVCVQLWRLTAYLSSKLHNHYGDVMGIPIWARGSHAAPLCLFLQVHFIFISSKLEGVNSIPCRQRLRLRRTFTISVSSSLHLLSDALFLPFSLFLKSNYFQRVALLGL